MRLLLRRTRRPSKPRCRIHKVAGVCATSAVSYLLCDHRAGPRLPRSLRPWRWTSRSWRGGGSGRNASSSSTHASRYRRLLVALLCICNILSYVQVLNSFLFYCTSQEEKKIERAKRFKLPIPGEEEAK